MVTKGHFSTKPNVTFSHATKSKATGMSHPCSLAAIARFGFVPTHGTQGNMKYHPEINDLDVPGSGE